MKNKLPEKVTGPDTVGLGYWKSEVNEMTLEELQRSHNQLIDYIAELTELVETRTNPLNAGGLGSRAGGISVLPEVVPEKFPKMGDTVYQFNSRGDILQQTWYASKKQTDRAKFLGTYRTHEEAQAHRDELLAKYK